MLISIGILAGRNKHEKFAWFMYTFGVWDIVYYVGLKLMIDWPESLMTWDLLFLIPAPWGGPVITPVLVSSGLIVSCICIVYLNDKEKVFLAPAWFWIAEALCGIIIIIAFLIDGNAVSKTGIPGRFPWPIFLSGYLTGLSLFFLRFLHSLKFQGNSDR